MHSPSKKQKYREIKKVSINYEGNSSFEHRVHRCKAKPSGRNNKLLNFKEIKLTAIEEEEYIEQMKFYSR